MKISIIIPTFRESKEISKLIKYLKNNSSPAVLKEIIVIDSLSPDGTLRIAREAGAKVYVIKKRQRAAALHFGACKATGDILYFLHADTYPPPDFLSQIISAVGKGYLGGSFRLSFDYKHWFLQLSCYFINLDINIFRFGDQSLFVSRKLYLKINGYNTNLFVMEDMDIVNRIKKVTKYKVLPAIVTTSARKFIKNGIYRLFLIYLSITILYYKGFSQEKLVKFYKLFIRS